MGQIVHGLIPGTLFTRFAASDTDRLNGIGGTR
jgi:hypothetical protein